MSQSDLTGFQTSGTTDAQASTTDDRPETCQCWDATLDLACWPCYRAGFTTQNPAEPAAEADAN